MFALKNLNQHSIKKGGLTPPFFPKINSSFSRRTNPFLSLFLTA
jgi:hypothetical protein